MRDYFIITEDGERTPVAKLSSRHIRECLQDGIELVEDGDLTVTEADILDRLRLELFIRELGLGPSAL